MNDNRGQAQRLLIIAYYFPPVRRVGARRLFFLYHQFLPLFEKIRVIAAANGRRMPQEPAWRTPAQIDYVRSPDLRTFLAQGKEVPATVDLPRERGTLIGELLRFRQAFPWLLLTDDGGWGYIRRAYKKGCQLVREEGITHLFTSFRPWSDHLVAYLLKRRYPHLIWIADFRDSHADPVRRDVLWPGLQMAIGRRLLRRADVLTTVSEGLAERLRPLHRQVVVLRNGLAALPPPFPTIGHGRYFTITYTGALYPGLQSADALFAALRQLLDSGQINPFHLELHYAGKDGDLWRQWTLRHGLNHLSRQLGIVSWPEACRLQRESQMNLLLSWSARDYGGILTAKLYDYLAAGRPIIALLNGPEDAELREVVEGTGAGRVFTRDAPVEDIQAFILDGYRTWAFSGGLPWQLNRAKLGAYTWEAQVAGLVERIF